ncbi:MAG: type IV pilus twitching motility protein PilT [Actinomycetota bacterium]|jgi:twitching motility protein PilT|nr:type IV pilus twitching motility protein PilT [Actinomycetota bacterium]
MEKNINELLGICIDLDASDLHLVVNSKPIVRINGVLRTIEEHEAFEPENLKKMLFEIIDENKIKKFEEKLELDFSYAIQNKGRFRCNYYFQRGTIAAAFRMVTSQIKSIEELGLPPKVKEFASYPRGLVLVCGPTGSGKSTTLASIINIINETRSENIITIEDPIEYLHWHKKSIVSQREIETDTTSFATALKHALREDPDVIMVGEMRDMETISNTLTAAETGHLVFSTLHTQDAAQTIDRIIDIFPTHSQQQVRLQLAGTLKAVLVQQLIPNKNNDGRVIAVELMTINPAIRNMIRDMKSHQIYTAMQSSGKEGMLMMDMSLAKLLKEGKISQELAFEKCHNKEELSRYISSNYIVY